MSSLTPEELSYFQAHADDTLQPNEIAANVCGYVFAVIAIILRITARKVSTAKFGPDDYLIVAAMVPLTAYAILMGLSTANGEGRHIIFVKNTKVFLQEYVAAIAVYSTAVVLTKFSILLYYRRIFSISRWVTVVSYIIAAVVVSYNVALIFVAAFECIPFSSLWTGKPGKCINVIPAYTGLAVVNVVTDFAILALPIKPVLGLQLGRGQKIQILGIFMLGGVVCVFGVVRTVAITNTRLVDASWTAAMSGIWSYTEISVGVVAACLPTLRPLFKKSIRSSHSSIPNRSIGAWGRLSPRRPSLTEMIRFKDARGSDAVELTDDRFGNSYESEAWVGSQHARSF